MTTFAMVVPYGRPPNHIPRRDLVLGIADSLSLQVSVIETDDPSAEALLITGGIGGPALRMAVWPVDYQVVSWDYGALWPQCGTPIWSGTGTISATLAGTFDVEMPVGTASSWPSRVAYGLQLDENSATTSTLLCTGILHVRRAQFGPAPAPAAITTDSAAAITDSSSFMWVA